MPFFLSFCRNPLTYIWNRVLVISLDGWPLGQWILCRCSPCVLSFASTKFELDRERRFRDEFRVETLVLWGFRGYLGEIVSVKSGSQKMQASMVRRWLHELEPMNHLENLGSPRSLCLFPAKPKPENIRCKINTDHPTHPAYACSSFLFSNLADGRTLQVPGHTQP